MPGTIHVSVPDFKDLPSSIPASSILTKVAVGKTEHQTWDKGDFSFPLTTLRDNVTITIQDTEGNEISQTVVQIMSVVERGSWDEFLSLEGGGNVHMRLQFVLSEEERNRIRSMRETAMKKKAGELHSNSLRGSETATSAGDTIAPSLGINHEVPDSQRSVTHNEALSIRTSPVRVGDEGGTAFDQRHIKPVKDESHCPVNNDTDGSEETSSATSISNSLEMDIGDSNHSKSLQTIETKLEHVDLPKRPVLLQETTSAMKKSLVASKLKMFQADQPEKRDLLGTTPSNVRKMISAFESSLAKDMRPGIKPPPGVKFQSKDPGTEDIAKPGKPSSEMLKKTTLFEESQRIQTYEAKREEHIGIGEGFNGDLSEKVIRKPVKPTSETLKNPFVIGESQRTQTYKEKKEERIAFDKDLTGSKSSQDVGQLEEQSTTRIAVEENESIPKPRGDLVRFGEVQEIQKCKVKREEHIGSKKGLNRSKSSQDAGQLKEPSITQIQVKETESNGENELRKRQEDLEGMSAIEAASVMGRRGSGMCSSYSHESGSQGETPALWETEHFSCKNSDAWIFPDHTRRLCITTGRKQVTDLVEGFGIQERTHKGETSFSLPDYEAKPITERGNGAEVMEGDETSQELRKTPLDNSTDVETSNGPLGQAVKVAIMVAFGVLVLLTRQRKHR